MMGPFAGGTTGPRQLVNYGRHTSYPGKAAVTSKAR